MRQFVIKQLHARVMNADETANLEYPEWKRRAWAVGAFVALRIASLVALAMIPLTIVLALVFYPVEAIWKFLKEVYSVTVSTVGAQYRNFGRDVRGCTNIWKGTYGRGKLLPEMRVKNPSAAPTPIED